MRFPDFEHDWESKKLKDLSNIQRGASPRPITAKKWYDNENKKVGWVRIGDVTSSSKYLTKTEDYFSEEGVKKSRFLPKGSLIMSICATIGKPIVTGMDTCIHDGFVGFSELKNINKEFLYYYLNILEPKFIFLSQTGSQANLNSDLVRNAEIGVPSIQEQEKIVNFISAVDKKHNILNKNLETQLSFKRYLMQQIFTQKLRFKNDKQWNVYLLRNFINEYNERMGNKSNLPILSSTLNGIFLQNEYFNKSVSSKDVKNYKIVPNGYFTYRSMSDTGKFRFNIQSIVEVGIISPAYPVFSTQNIDDYFLYYYLNNSNFIKKQILSLKEGGTRYALSFSKFKKLKISLPSLEEQEKIANFLSAVDKKIDLIQTQIQKMEEFKKGLLQQMFVVRINWRCNFKLAKSPSFNKHLLILKNKIIFIIIK